MKKIKIGLALIGAIFITLTWSVAPSSAGVNVHVGIGIPLPPPLVIPVPPPVVPIPRTSVYFPPTIDVEILFFGGYWYRPYQDHWFRSRSYNGPWVFLEPHRVPRALIGLPPDYRHIPPGYRHIPYGQFKKNWGRWDRERYWDRDHDWRREYWRPQRSSAPYRDQRRIRPRPDQWQEGGPPGHSGGGDRWDGGGPPGHRGKGDKGEGRGGERPGHPGRGKGH
jgi:hypothetical protein